MKANDDLFRGLLALPSFPAVFVTVGRNIMVVAAFHFYSFRPPSGMVGIRGKDEDKYAKTSLTPRKGQAIDGYVISGGYRRQLCARRRSDVLAWAI
ncbi:MAG TPA: hypothetical protein DDW87_02405 [Firmicutes bacterium]|nr:hypothetical protein [Bacillota bacterium]